jgi:hypothetical protein
MEDSDEVVESPRSRAVDICQWSVPFSHREREVVFQTKMTRRVVMHGSISCFSVVRQPKLAFLTSCLINSKSFFYFLDQ